MELLENKTQSPASVAGGRWRLWLRAGWVLLTLSSFWIVFYSLVWLYQYFQNLPDTLTRALSELGVSRDLFFLFNVFFVLVIYVSFFVVAQLIMLRRPPDRFGALAAVVLLNFGTANAVPALPDFLHLLFAPPLYFGIPFYAHNFLAWTLAGAFIVSYPDGKFVPRWSLWLATGSALLSALWSLNIGPFNTGRGLVAFSLTVIVLVGLGLMLYAQIWRYRYHLTSLQRQQVKWFIFGFAVYAVTFAPTVPLTNVLLDPTVSQTQLLQGIFAYAFFFLTGMLALPLSIGFAILRYRLWDIDVIIRRTLIYSLLTAILALAYFGSIILLQQVFRGFTGQGSDLAIIISTLAIAALFNPLRRRVQNIIDRRFYRGKYDAQQVLARFAATARDEVELEKLTGELLNVVTETMQPTSASLWLKNPGQKANS
ncbi:MAG TPA: hypothetical protein VF478_07750 [Anaerolineae bacterium]